MGGNLKCSKKNLGGGGGDSNTIYDNIISFGIYNIYFVYRYTDHVGEECWYIFLNWLLNSVFQFSNNLKSSIPNIKPKHFNDRSS